MFIAAETVWVVVERNFDRWDANHDGRLSATETDALVTDPKLRGADAAALGALKQAQRTKKWRELRWTRELLRQLQARSVSGPDLGRAFRAALQKIERTERVLFSPEAPRLTELHQGRLGDCFFLAPLGAAIHRSPVAVKQLITEVDKGRYSVAFPGTAPLEVTALTDTELVLTSGTENSGLWLQVLEKAYGAHRNRNLPPEQQKGSTTDLIANGGSSRPVIAALTGHKTERFQLRGQTLELYRQVLSEAVAAQGLIVSSTPEGVPVPGISSRHAYAVLGYDPKADLLELWNPHGNNFKPKGEPGLKHGYPTRNGRFKVPVAEWVTISKQFVYERKEEGKH